MAIENQTDDPVRKVSATLPEGMVGVIDAWAHNLNLNRSQMLRRLVEAGLEVEWTEQHAAPEPAPKPAHRNWWAWVCRKKRGHTNGEVTEP